MSWNQTENLPADGLIAVINNSEGNDYGDGDVCGVYPRGSFRSSPGSFTQHKGLSKIDTTPSWMKAGLVLRETMHNKKNTQLRILNKRH